MFRSTLMISTGTGLVLAMLAGAAAAPPAAPADNRQPAPVPDAQGTPAPQFQTAPVPRQTDGKVRLSAPVAAPYSGTAYRDLGGQPETSADALDSQGSRPR